MFCHAKLVETGRQREHPVRLELRLPPERGHDAAVQQFLGGVDDKAVVCHGSPRVEAAAEADAVRQPGIERDVEEVVGALNSPNGSRDVTKFCTLP